MEKNLELEKKLNVVAAVITVAVLILVGLMRQVKIPLPEGVDLHFLAPFHAGVNALTAIVLLFSLVFIKQKKVELHRKANYTALFLSVLFILSYVAYHFTTPSTIYGDVDGNGVLSAAERSAAGSGRTWYLVLLLSHIGLAALSLPFILLTFIRAYTNQFERHRKMARWVWPVWFYVALTGPIVYFLLRPYY
jgi:putative membrane protein